MIGLGKVSLIGLGVVAGTVSVMGGQLASAQSRSNAAAAATPVLTADTDIAQLQSGYVAAGVFQPIAHGPFVMTAVVTKPTYRASVSIVVGTTCPSSPATGKVLEAEPQVTGIRIPVPAGSVACLYAYNYPATWAGYVPY
ncbi:hypothetical protein LVJ94_28070 [Pendulispora rubella]|uniref:Uncharacterized protein n=1 Tax=Pendulispora rubella TaxID=2741070 RepID=A0ABZ2KQJ1_9BACT